MATLKLPFALEKPSASIGVCDVTEIWDSVNSQWLSVTVTGGGGATYTAGDGISISSKNVLSVKAATSGAYGGVKLGFTSAETNRAVQLDGNGKAYVALQAATNVAKGTVQLSDSTTITTDLTSQNDTKAVTPKALASAMSTTISSAVATEVSGKFVVTTKAAYDLLTPDANKFYFCTEN
jgi:hypothetical protein